MCMHVVFAALHFRIIVADSDSGGVSPSYLSVAGELLKLNVVKNNNIKK